MRLFNLKHKRGAGLAEYGLLAGLVGAVAIAAVAKSGSEVKSIFVSATDEVSIGLDKSILGARREELPPSIVDVECYNPANIGTVGLPGWAGCGGTYIISNSEFDEITGGSDRPYRIKGPDGEVYTLDNSGRNIFTGQVTDFVLAFRATNGEPGYDGSIGHLDVSNVTNFRGAFYKNEAFNGYIGGWDVSSGTNFHYMFEESSFNQPLGEWDMSSAVNLESMFRDSPFNQPIGDWRFGAGPTSMKAMFDRAEDFNQDISGWNTENVNSFAVMFWGANSFNQPLNSWDVSGADSFGEMFEDARNFNQDISSWSLKAGANMREMFRGAVAYNRDLSALDVSGVTSCSGFSLSTPSWVAPKPNFTNCTP